MTAERAADPTPRDAAMSQLLTGMQQRLRAFLRRLAGADVDDLAQETLTRAWRSRQTFDAERGAIEPWLLRIAFRAYLDLRRKAGATAPDPGNQVAAERDPAHVAEVREHAAALLGCLTSVERDVLLRFHRDGESIEQIARSLAIPNGTVKSHLHRARNRMWAIEHRTGGTP